MSSRSLRAAALGGVGVLVAAWLVALTHLPAIGANALLHPARRQLAMATPDGCVTRTVEGVDVTLKGWNCEARQSRGTIVYLHGVADNRASGLGLIQRFVSRGLNVVAFDSRAHGDSTGDACTYGYFEQDDLRRIAPFVFTARTIDRAFVRAETDAHFHVDAVSPVVAARSIGVPALLVHGAADVDTPPSHSTRILDALAGPKRLILVPGLHHNDALPAAVWDEIERWISAALERPAHAA